ncbi:MAG TPA: hypothetical protein ENI23_10440 [bacterium]|nr:hypothetical protein [bacterium]
MPLLKDYYRVREWDEEGFPTEKKLRGLGLEEYSSILKYGKPGREIGQ